MKRCTIVALTAIATSLWALAGAGRAYMAFRREARAVGFTEVISSAMEHSLAASPVWLLRGRMPERTSKDS